MTGYNKKNCIKQLYKVTIAVSENIYIITTSYIYSLIRPTITGNYILTACFYHW